MSRPSKPRQTRPRRLNPDRATPLSRRLILACAVALAVLLLFLRMLRYVHGLGRR